VSRKYILFSLALLLFITQTVSIASSQTVRNCFEFGYVKSDYDWTGESIWLANSKRKDRVASKSVAALGASGSGKININGNDSDLKLVKYWLPRSNNKAGRGGYQIWKGSEVLVRIDYIFTKVCLPGDEDECLVYSYKGVMDVTYKGRRKKVKIRGLGSS
jgi:hypothetical protein